MKVVEQSQSTLTMRHFPFALWMVGVIFAATAIPLILFIGKSVTVECTRQGTGEIACFRVTRGLLESRKDALPGKTLENAYVSSSEDDDGAVSYQIILVTDASKVPLTDYSSSNFEEKQKIVNDITRFINHSDQDSIAVTEDDRLIVFIISGFFLLAGLLLILLPGILTLTIDKNTGVFQMNWRSIFHHKEIDIPLRDISQIGLDSNSSGSSHRICIQTRSGETYPLTSYYSSGIRGKQKDIDTLSGFLNITGENSPDQTGLFNLNQ
jgi:hypothetical protein